MYVYTYCEIDGFYNRLNRIYIYIYITRARAAMNVFNVIPAKPELSRAHFILLLLGPFLNVT